MKNASARRIEAALLAADTAATRRLAAVGRVIVQGRFERAATGKAVFGWWSASETDGSRVFLGSTAEQAIERIAAEGGAS